MGSILALIISMNNLLQFPPWKCDCPLTTATTRECLQRKHIIEKQSVKQNYLAFSSFLIYSIGCSYSYDVEALFSFVLPFTKKYLGIYSGVTKDTCVASIRYRRMFANRTFSKETSGGLHCNRPKHCLQRNSWHNRTIRFRTFSPGQWASFELIGSEGTIKRQ